VLGVAGAGLVVAGALASPVESGSLLAGTAAITLGVLALGPALAWSLARLLGAPIRRVAGVVGALASGNAARQPRRTAATVLPLVIGLTLISFLTTLAAGTKRRRRPAGSTAPYGHTTGSRRPAPACTSRC
jgi:putative ABC transport system permease protein